jgi:hypothetical protein
VNRFLGWYRAPFDENNNTPRIQNWTQWTEATAPRGDCDDNRLSNLYGVIFLTYEYSKVDVFYSDEA